MSENINYMTYPDGYKKYAETLTAISDQQEAREAFLLSFAKTILIR